MWKLNKKPLIILVSIVLLGETIQFTGVKCKWLMINTSSSEAMGLYYSHAVKERDLQVGRKISFNLSVEQQKIIRKLNIWNGEELLKTIYAVPGDYLTVNDSKVIINGLEHKELIILHQSSTGIMVQPIKFDGRIPQNHYFVIGTHSPRSFDSRYLGLIASNQITNILNPILIFN